jgi:dipeptidyl aminopeptidase/acylaminoacyl peptidase
LTSIRIRWRTAASVIAVFLIACLGLASLTAERSYRAARSQLGADPPSPLLKHPESVGLAGLQAISFISRDGLHIAGWYVPSKNRAAVIITHGTNSDRATMLPEIRLLAEAGFGVLAFDWPGLGESEGTILWGAAARGALTAAIDWVAARADADPDRIGGLGFSIGGFVMTQVAASDRRLRAMTLESAPSSFDAYVEIHFAKWGFLSEWSARRALRGSDLLSIDASPIRLIADVSPRPLLIIGESDDPEIPASMTRALYAAAREPKSLWLIRGSQHGGYAQAAGAEYGRRLRSFFAQNLLERAHQ